MKATYYVHGYLFYPNNLPKRFIISVLCSSSELAYRFNVTVGFEYPMSSESVLTSMSIARVAKYAVTIENT